MRYRFNLQEKKFYFMAIGHIYIYIYIVDIYIAIKIYYNT